MSEPNPRPVAAHEQETLPPAPAVDPRQTVDHVPQPTDHDQTQKVPTAELPQVPGYEVLGVLGKGGMGVVYKARQRLTNRIVALKMIRAGGRPDVDLRLRFLREMEAMARVQHPYVVQIYESGSQEGDLFLAMEYIDGPTLADHSNHVPQPPAWCAAVVANVARAVHHGHEKGVVHRDLKPGNILLASPGRESGEVIPKVTDFGLARQVDVGPGHTATGVVMGTPSFMAPEQALGEAKRVGPAADVWALGAILYDLLTGRPPFLGATDFETLQQVVAVEPVPPRQWQPKVPRDLETICLKCLQKDERKRYGSAAELAQDLRRFRAGEPIAARPVGLLERGWRWCRRNPALAGLLSAVAVLLILGTTVASALAVWALGEKHKADAALLQADREQQQRALAQVNALLTAAPEAVPAILGDLERQREVVLPRLRDLWRVGGREPPEGGDEAKRMRLALALLPVEPDKVRDDLAAWLLKAREPAEVLLVRQVLQPHKDELRERFWSQAEDTTAPAAERFRALVALAAFDPDSERWKDAGEQAVAEMLSANPLHLGPWVEALRPVKGSLLGALGEVFRGTKLAEFRTVAATVLADCAADNPELLAGLMLDADVKQFAILKPVLETGRARAVERLRRELAAKGEDLPTAERERLARRQAQAGVTLLHLGDAESVWPLLQHTPDPEARSQLLWRMSLHKVDAQLWVERLKAEKDDSARRALIIGLGEFTAADLPPVRDPLTAKLLQWYRDDPDPGVHGAIDWLLRYGKEGLNDRPLDWGKAQELDQIDEELKRRDPDGVRRWYVNQQGQTMVLLPMPEGRPHEFRMGAPADEPKPDPKDERLHVRKIPRNFAIASKAVTVAQWKRFLKDRPDVPQNYTENYSPNPDCPINAVSWYAAAEYCNWLSEQEGLPETEWCYPKDPKEIKDGMKPFKDYLQRKGYRLPSEAEWECACRAGADSSRYYGSSIDLLPRYAWYLANSADRMWPVGQKRPNDLGLFDMHGNAWTWVQDPGYYYPPGEVIVDKEDIRDIKDIFVRVLRGGSSPSPPLGVRSAYRFYFRPDIRYDVAGLRVARTYD